MSSTNPMATIIAAIICLILAIPLGMWTDSNLEFWISRIAGRPVEVPYILSYGLTVFTNLFGIVGNLLMELAKLAV